MMGKSNIVVKSNIFPCNGFPFTDSDFVAQICDRHLISQLYEQRKTDYRVVNLTTKQYRILSYNPHCKYGTNDPCWDYVETEGCMINKCIRGECKSIGECNPDYSREYQEEWTLHPEEVEKYPEFISPEDISVEDDEEQKILGVIREYYFVNLPSLDERLMYFTDPNCDDAKYLIKHKVNQDNVGITKKTRFNKSKNRWEQVVGHRWMIDDGGSYENEHLVEIWDVVDDVPSHAAPARKVIEVDRNDKSAKKDSITNRVKNERSYLDCIIDHTINKVRLTTISMDTFGDGPSVIVFSNRAEMAYVSSMLLVNNIAHGYNDENIILVVIDDFVDANNRKVFYSSGVISSREVDSDGLANLSALSRLVQLSISDREYYRFERGNTYRWCCRNLQGVTHICIDVDDIIDLTIKNGDSISSTIIKCDVDYCVRDTSGNIIGRMNENFVRILMNLCENGDIPEMPISISGISVVMNDLETSVLGIGHLKFACY